MANLARVRVDWSGTSLIGSGVSTFYFNEGSLGFIADLTTFWETVAAVIPNTTALQIPTDGDLIDVDTGELSGTWSASGGGTVIGEAPLGWVEGVGARIRWNTAGIRGGRRVRGSTFLVPLDQSQFDNAGRLDTACIVLVNDACAALVAAQSPDFVVYSRRSGVLAGQANVVTSGVLPDAISWLRSRRT